MTYAEFLTSRTTLEVVRDVLGTGKERHEANRRLVKLQVPITTNILTISKLLTKYRLHPVSIRTLQSIHKMWYVEYICWSTYLKPIKIEDELPYCRIHKGKVRIIKQ